MAMTLRNTDILFNNGTTQSTAGISAQNCSYTGSLVELSGIDLSGVGDVTFDLGSNRVMTGMRRRFDNDIGGVFLHVRGHNIKNTA
jgi:hypothetical protein